MDWRWHCIVSDWSHFSGRYFYNQNNAHSVLFCRELNIIAPGCVDAAIFFLEKKKTKKQNNKDSCLLDSEDRGRL